MAPLANRLKQAAVGVSLTVAPLALAVVVQFILLPQIVASFGRVEGHEMAQTVSTLRWEWITLHTIAAALVVLYWLLAALLGKGQFLRLRAANATLAAAILSPLALALYSSFVQWPEDMKSICPWFGISDTDWEPYTLDGGSSCDGFVYAFHTIAVLGLVGLFIVLLATSLIIRVASSRCAPRE